MCDSISKHQMWDLAVVCDMNHMGECKKISTDYVF
jgi:hypothetical protein